jgi:hypothetical protein
MGSGIARSNGSGVSQVIAAAETHNDNNHNNNTSTTSARSAINVAAIQQQVIAAIQTTDIQSGNPSRHLSSSPTVI